MTEYEVWLDIVSGQTLNSGKWAKTLSVASYLLNTYTRGNKMKRILKNKRYKDGSTKEKLVDFTFETVEDARKYIKNI